MRELMLKLLTYEPFEKISGDEKTYIDAVLAGDTNVAQSFALYDELMKAFKYFVDTVMPLNFDARVQDIVSYISETLAEKGIYPTCHDINGGCSSDCAFHEAEFGKESAK